MNKIIPVVEVLNSTTKLAIELSRFSMTSNARRTETTT
jgi:hypothetical protein